MHILHAGRFEHGSVHGTHHALWQLATAQVRAGHQVTICNLGWEVPEEQVRAAARDGVKLIGFPVRRIRALRRDKDGEMRRRIAALKPDVAHLQYVRIAEFVPFTDALVRVGVPYVVSLHGGMKPAEMQRHRLRKLLWWRFVERRVHRAAAGLHFVTERERDEYYGHFGPVRAADAVVANVVETGRDTPDWKGWVDNEAPQLVTLGRYDVWHKGLDKAAHLTRSLHRRGIRAGLDLHGSPVGRFEAPIRALLAAHRDLPVYDRGVVLGAAKFARLTAADLYVQYSRFELFGMALVEALRVGTPVALSEACDLAPTLAAANAAIVLPMDPEHAAAVLAEELAHPNRIVEMAARGRHWWRHNCRAEVVVAGMTAMYEQAVRLSSRPRAATRPHTSSFGLRSTVF